MLANIRSDYSRPPPERSTAEADALKDINRRTKVLKTDQGQQDSWFDRARLRIHCSFFCGGSQCKHENWEILTEQEKRMMTIEGLNSNWVGEKIVASQRPSTSLFVKYPLIAEFKRHGITGVFNLQEKGEHANCGPDGVYESSGYSYNGPEDLMSHGISYYEFPWPDMTAPQQDIVLRSVQVMDYHVRSGGRALVHCHAGLGRTGLMIACYYVYTRMPSKQAIELVRATRRGAIQTTSQAQFIGDFEKHLWRLSQAFRVEISDALIDLTMVLHRQYAFLHGERAYLYKYIPYFLHSLLCRLRVLGDRDPAVFEIALRNMSPDRSPEPSVLSMCRIAINYRYFDYERVDDADILSFLVFDWFRSLSTPVLSADECDRIVDKMREGRFEVGFVREVLGKAARHTMGVVVSCYHYMAVKTGNTALMRYAFRTMVNAFNHAFNPIKVRHSPIERELLVNFFIQWGESIGDLYFSLEGCALAKHETIRCIATAAHKLFERARAAEAADAAAAEATAASTQPGFPALSSPLDMTLVSNSGELTSQLLSGDSPLPLPSPTAQRPRRSVVDMLSANAFPLSRPQQSNAFYQRDSDDDRTDPV